MSKRLTDTEKWKDEWYLSLNNDYRIVWQYILDNCSHAGVFKKSFDLMNFCCHTHIKEVEFLEIFKTRVIDCKNFYFIPKFLAFQYTNLKSSRPVILSVINELERLNILSMVDESLLNDCHTIKSKSMAKRTAKSKEGIVKGNQQKPFSFIPPKEDVDKLLGRSEK